MVKTGWNIRWRYAIVNAKESEQFRFQNLDVQTVFDVSRNIFKKNYGKIEEIYCEQEIDSELGLVIGTITESKELINHALERKGGRIDMCNEIPKIWISLHISIISFSFFTTSESTWNNLFLPDSQFPSEQILCPVPLF